MRLIELSAAYQSLLFRIDSEDELPLEAELDKVCDALDVKLESCGWVLRTLEAEAEAYKKEADRLAAKAKRAGKEAERLKNYIAACLRGEAMKTKSFSFSFRKSEAVEVFDEDKLPSAYWRMKTSKDIAKDVIKQDLKNGAVIPGCGLITNNNLQVR